MGPKSRGEALLDAGFGAYNAAVTFVADAEFGAFDEHCAAVDMTVSVAAACATAWVRNQQKTFHHLHLEPPRTFLSTDVLLRRSYIISKLRYSVKQERGIQKIRRVGYTVAMILTYHEGACIRASAGDTTVVLGPVSKASKNFKPINFGADVAFVSLNDVDMNGSGDAARGEKQAFSIFGPGEYEVKEISCTGFPSGSSYGGKPRTNTIYSLHFDGLSVLYLGALGDMDIPSEVLEMDSPDILIIPVGGEGTLNAAEAEKIAVKLEAKIIIPILYDEKTLKLFLKESGADSVKPVEKLTLKPRDVSGKENEVVVLSA